MKVIFIQDVTNVAKAGDVKEVPSGYGRNYLLPKKLAVLADSTATMQHAQALIKEQRRSGRQTRRTDGFGKRTGWERDYSQSTCR